MLIFAERIETMDFEIVEIPEFSGGVAKIYSIMLGDDDQALIDKFFEENSEYDAELKGIASKLIVMGQSIGCRRQFFKEFEGAPGDGVVALAQGRLRLYCLRYDNTCIFIGDGGYKSPDIRAYQEDPILNAKALQMRKIAAKINRAIREKDIIVKDDGTIEISEFAELSI